MLLQVSCFSVAQHSGTTAVGDSLGLPPPDTLLLQAQSQTTPSTPCILGHTLCPFNIKNAMFEFPISMHWQTRGGKAWWRLARCPCSACCAQSVPGVCSALHCATVVAKQ
eukprot:EG_transcript_59035